MLLGGMMGPRQARVLAQWIVEEGLGDDFLRDFNWEGFEVPTAPQELYSKIEGYIARFFLSKTKEELLEGAIKRRLVFAPVTTIADMAHSPQFASRDFLVNIEHSDLGESLTYPGAFVKASLTPCLPKGRAPLIGEHNEEVYGEIGVSKEELVMLKQAGVV